MWESIIKCTHLSPEHPFSYYFFYNPGSCIVPGFPYASSVSFHCLFLISFYLSSLFLFLFWWHGHFQSARTRRVVECPTVWVCPHRQTHGNVWGVTLQECVLHTAFSPETGDATSPVIGGVRSIGWVRRDPPGLAFSLGTSLLENRMFTQSPNVAQYFGIH